MTLNVRTMTLPETGLIIEYFHTAAPEHLETMGVDPTRLPAREAWRERFADDFARPIEQRQAFQTIWLEDERAIGFSTTDKIVFGEQANMHLHMIDAHRRNNGAGAPCVQQSVNIYFEAMRLKRLFCEPNAFNIAPNRTLQKAGFKYLKTPAQLPPGRHAVGDGAVNGIPVMSWRKQYSLRKNFRQDRVTRRQRGQRNTSTDGELRRRMARHSGSNQSSGKTPCSAYLP